MAKETSRDLAWCKNNCPLGTTSGDSFVADAVLEAPDGPGIVLVLSHPTASELGGRRWWAGLVPAGVRVLAVVHEIRCISRHWQAHYTAARAACVQRYQGPRVPRPQYLYCALDMSKAIVSEVFRDLIRADIARAYRLAVARGAVVWVLFGREPQAAGLPWAAGLQDRQLRGSWWRAI